MGKKGLSRRILRGVSNNWTLGSAVARGKLAWLRALFGGYFARGDGVGGRMPSAGYGCANLAQFGCGGSVKRRSPMT